jgi:hypothetical protein
MKHLTSFWELLRFYCRITSNPSVAILFILFLLGVFPSMLRRNLFITFEFQADANRLEKRGAGETYLLTTSPYSSLLPVLGNMYKKIKVTGT